VAKARAKAGKASGKLARPTAKAKAAQRPGGKAGQRSSGKGAPAAKGKARPAAQDKTRAAPANKAARARAEAESAALRKRCTSPTARKSAACKALATADKDRAQDEARDRTRQRCRSKTARKTKACKTFAAGEARRGQVTSICGRRYGQARRGEKVGGFARRHRVSEGTVRALNGLGTDVKKLKGGKRYLVFKSPHDGVVLRGGSLLTAEPEGYLLQRPERGWGKPLAVDVIRTAIRQVHASSPMGTALVVGDLSKQGGGCLPPHRSHRGGLDADIGYYMRGARQRGWLGLATPRTMDADRTWQLLRGFLTTGRLRYAFIDHGLQVPLYDAALRAGETPESLSHVFQHPRPIGDVHQSIIRHLKGHADHMHVRFTCGDDGDGDEATCALPEPTMTRMLAVRMDFRGGPVDEHMPRRRRGPLRARDAGVAIPLAMP